MRLLALASATLVACGSSSSKPAGGAAEPDKAVRAFGAAVGRGDAPAMRRLLVPPDRIRAALSCPGAENLVNDVDQAFVAMRELDRVGSSLRTLELAVGAVDETSRSSVARGETFHGCTTREPIEARRYRVSMTAQLAGEEESTEQDLEVVRLDGVWWLLPLS